jgi:hypothetical protein
VLSILAGRIGYDARELATSMVGVPDSRPHRSTPIEAIFTLLFIPVAAVSWAALLLAEFGAGAAGPVLVLAAAVGVVTLALQSAFGRISLPLEPFQSVRMAAEFRFYGPSTRYFPR